MVPEQEAYDDAMFDFSTGDYAGAATKLEALLAKDPAFFDAQLSLGMAYCRLGDYPRAIKEGLRAEKMRPTEQLVHTNLSLFYMRAGDKTSAERHGLQARIASWRGNMDKPAQGESGSTPEANELQVGAPPAQPVKLPGKFPETPWKKAKPTAATATPPQPPTTPSPQTDPGPNPGSKD